MGGTKTFKERNKKYDQGKKKSANGSEAFSRRRVEERVCRLLALRKPKAQRNMSEDVMDASVIILYSTQHNNAALFCRWRHQKTQVRGRERARGG